jgi:hypothetical protein
LNVRTGQPVWNLETHGAILGPALVRKGMVFVGSADGHVYAAAGATGQIAWKFRTEGRIESCLALAGDAVLAGSADHFLYALQPATGTLLWKADAGAPLLFAPRLAAGPRVLVPTPKAPGDAHTMTAVSLAEHKVLSVGDAFPVAVDLAGNGSTNQIVVSEHGTTCFAGDGKTVVWTNEYAASSAYTADVNGDGWLDLVFNNGPDELLCISGRDGSQLGRIHLETAVGRAGACIVFRGSAVANGGLTRRTRTTMRRWRRRTDACWRKPATV